MINPRSPEEIFSDAIELEGAARAAFLDSECSVGTPLRAEVESLLRIADGDPALLDFPNKEDGEQELPATVGRYRVLERCGAGGMGIVYKAEDPVLHRTVALKVLQGRQRIGSADVERLEAEARYLATLNHPNVATIYALERDGEVPFLVMEFVPGRTLAEALRADAVSAVEFLRICAGIAAGLGAAHERGIIHRDLKPANVMIADGGIVKLLDFGIAKSLLGRSGEVQPGNVQSDSQRADAPVGHTVGIGTPAYMSPEQQLGLAADRRSDIWAFGLLLVEYLRSNPVGLAERTRRKLERLSVWCRQDVPDARPASMEIVRKEIDAALAEILPRRGARLLVMAAALVVAIAGIVGGVRFISYLRAVPLAVHSTEHSVEADYSDGSRRFLPMPVTVTDKIDSAFVATKPDGSRLVVAWTREEAERGGTLLLWNRRGKLVKTFGTTEDGPFDGAGRPVSAMYGRKMIAQVSAHRNSASTIDAIELSHYFPSVLRRFKWDGSDVRETYRLYHAGNISRELYSPGLEPGSEWLWLSGRIRDGGELRRAAGGVEGNTHFLACFDAKTVGTEVYPALDSATVEFGAGLLGEPRFAKPILYFVVRGYTVVGDRIDWISGTSMMIADAVRGEDGSIAVLLANTLRFDILQAADGSIDVALSAGSELQRVMEARAGRMGQDVGEVTRAFLEDSVVTLVGAGPGLRLRMDVRNAVPLLGN